MKFVNLTPHAIVVRTPEGDLTFPPSGDVARVATSQQNLPPVGGVEVRKTTFGELTMPAPQEGVAYIVSALVLGRCKGRSDVFGPDTGPSAIRENGQIVAVTGLVAP